MSDGRIFIFRVDYPFKVDKLLIYIKNTKMTFQYIINDANMWRAHYMLLML